MNANLSLDPSAGRTLPVDGTPIALRVPAGSAIFSVQGEVWITQERNLDDIILGPGERFDVPTREPLVISATRGHASLYIVEPRPARAHPMRQLYEFARSRAGHVRREASASALEAALTALRALWQRGSAMLAPRSRATSRLSFAPALDIGRPPAASAASSQTDDMGGRSAYRRRSYLQGTEATWQRVHGLRPVHAAPPAKRSADRPRRRPLAASRCWSPRARARGSSTPTLRAEAGAPTVRISSATSSITSCSIRATAARCWPRRRPGTWVRPSSAPPTSARRGRKRSSRPRSRRRPTAAVAASITRSG